MSPTATHLVSPNVRIHHASPTPSSERPHLQLQQHQQQQQLQSQVRRQPMLAQNNFYGWNDPYSGGYLSALPKDFRNQQHHKRGSSGSSVASGGPPSPMTAGSNTIFPQIATSESIYPSSYEFDYSQTPRTPKSLPNSVQDATAMMYRSSLSAADMRRIQSSGADERASYNTLSAPQSVSSLGQNSPATPQTNYETDYDDSKNVYGEDFDETEGEEMDQYLQLDLGYSTTAYAQPMQDSFAEQFVPMTFQQTQPAMQRLSQHQHQQNMMAGRLQAANQDHLRTNSPTSNPRDKSPFRQSSPYSVNGTMQRPQPIPTLQKTRTSVSPKELMLGEHDIDESSNSAALFPDQSHTMYATRNQPSGLSNFYNANSFTTDSSMQIPHQYGFLGQSGQSNGIAEPTPEFTPHLMRMESTAEEGPSMPSSQQSLVESKPQLRQQQQPSTSSAMHRPVDTSSDAGTYSCTYHGCSLRFDTPAKLQKHKREGHRQLSPTASMSPSLGLRNSQAGPHRCDRLNPTTGKSCNSIFSRPYDLTRHEDTIHNGRKQKVRCHLCTEEKTFSRNDALTRHMRVVHPDVDWVGKQKRKSPK